MELWQFLQSIHFENPHFIWWRNPVSFGCLLLVSAIAATSIVWWVWYRWRLQAVKDYGSIDLVTRWTALPRLGPSLVLLAGLVSMVVLGVTAATMPYQALGEVSVPSGTLRVVALFDVSRSMAAENRDEPKLYGGRSCTLVEGPCGRRLETARLILLNQVMPVIKGNQLGVVVYAGGAITKSVLSDDFAPIETMLTRGWIEVGAGMGDGTYLHSGINAAVDIFNRSPAKSNETNVILLFTDGENHSKPEDLAAALAAARKANAQLFIVGVGSTKPAYIPVYDGNDKPVFEKDGTRSFHKFNDGNVAETARNDSFLQQLATDAGGRYVISETGQKLEISWPSSLAGSRVEVAKRYWYGPLVGAALVILTFIWLVGPLANVAAASAAARNAKRDRR
jgi:hypothetical protein